MDGWTDVVGRGLIVVGRHAYSGGGLGLEQREI